MVKLYYQSVRYTGQQNIYYKPGNETEALQDAEENLKNSKLLAYFCAVDEEQKQNLDTWTEEQLRQYLKCNNHGQFSLSKQNRYNKHIEQSIKQNKSKKPNTKI